MIYGAGIFGEELHEKFPKELVLSGWVDKQADYYQSLGKPVSSVKEIASVSFDYIVIAVLNPSTADQIENNLLEICIPAEKILRISEQCIDSTYTKNKMQELENVDENYRYVPATVSPDSRE